MSKAILNKHKRISNLANLVRNIAHLWSQSRPQLRWPDSIFHREPRQQMPQHLHDSQALCWFIFTNGFFPHQPTKRSQFKIYSSKLYIIITVLQCFNSTNKYLPSSGHNCLRSQVNHRSVDINIMADLFKAQTKFRSVFFLSFLLRQRQKSRIESGGLQWQLWEIIGKTGLVSRSRFEQVYDNSSDDESRQKFSTRSY